MRKRPCLTPKLRLWMTGYALCVQAMYEIQLSSQLEVPIELCQSGGTDRHRVPQRRDSLLTYS